ncbi:hypothetical protein VT84_04830 [Gemmata sp. SH-PL17]|nr:hypothetical protein VT84_04830 [Gemmata sp. SH-PL17]
MARQVFTSIYSPYSADRTPTGRRTAITLARISISVERGSRWSLFLQDGQVVVGQLEHSELKIRPPRPLGEHRGATPVTGRYALYESLRGARIEESRGRPITFYRLRSRARDSPYLGGSRCGGFAAFARRSVFTGRTLFVKSSANQGVDFHKSRAYSGWTCRDHRFFFESPCPTLTFLAALVLHSLNSWW